jgi:hypothetical protein
VVFFWLSLKYALRRAKLSLILNPPAQELKKRDGKNSIRGRGQPGISSVGSWAYGRAVRASLKCRHAKDNGCVLPWSSGPKRAGTAQDKPRCASGESLLGALPQFVCRLDCMSRTFAAWVPEAQGPAVVSPALHTTAAPRE